LIELFRGDAGSESTRSLLTSYKRGIGKRLISYERISQSRRGASPFPPEIVRTTHKFFEKRLLVSHHNQEKALSPDEGMTD